MAVPSFFLLLIVAIALGWFVHFESASYQRTQLDLAKATVKGIVNNISQYVEQRRQVVHTIVSEQRSLLLEIADFPVDKDNLALLSESVKSHLPDNFTYLLSDSDGLPLLEEKVIKLGTECKDGLIFFSQSPGKLEETVVMHGLSPEDYHFDVMANIDTSPNSPIFFVSFRALPLLNLLRNSQIPGQSLLVVNNATPERIEMSAKGVFQSALFGNSLNDNYLAKTLYRETVPGTGWSILALPNTDLISEYKNKLMLRSAYAFVLLVSVLFIFLWRLWVEESSRLLAEEGLKRSNNELELKVEQRTLALEKSEQNLLNTFMSAPYGMMVINEDGLIELINKSASGIFGYVDDELLNQGMDILLPENVRGAHVKHRESFNDNPQNRLMGTGRHLLGRRKNGTEFAVEVGLSSLDHSDGHKIIASISDVSELVIAEQKLMEEHERAMVTLNSIGDGVITTDIDGEINSINPVAERLSGWTEEDAIGRHISQVFMVVNEKTGEKVEDPVIQCLCNKEIVELGNDTVLVHRHGLEIPIEDSAAPIKNADGLVVGAVLVFHDVSQSRAHANEIEHQANHDALTGLLNRREFDRRLQKSVVKARDSNAENILLFMDLDRFKIVNDSAGHAAGDELLKQLTKLMSGQLRQRDTFARLGGDEFAVLLEFCSKDIGLKVANKLRSSVQDFRFFWKGQVFNVGISIGLVEFSNSAETADNLLSEADAACYTAKEGGRNRVQVYDSAAARKRGESSIVNLLTESFENNRMTLFQQEIRSTEVNQQRTHFEILVRMISEDGELISPAMFLPAAERYGLAITLDRWVIKTVFRWLSINQTKFSRPILLSINLSGQSIMDKYMVGYIQQQFNDFNIDKDTVCFEITETAAMNDLFKAKQFIDEIKLLGCKFSLDDFGSGHASYAHLKNLPVDFLKIDGMFVKDITHDPIDFAIVKSVNEVGQVSGMQTIAEFVENEEIIEKLTEIGVNFLQGYAISHPAPLDKLLDAN